MLNADRWAAGGTAAAPASAAARLTNARGFLALAPVFVALLAKLVTQRAAVLGRHPLAVLPLGGAAGTLLAWIDLALLRAIQPRVRSALRERAPANGDQQGGNEHAHDAGDCRNTAAGRLSLRGKRCNER